MKKIGLLVMALVVAMGLLGVGYAMWSEDLTIDGTVNTGDVDVEWSLEAWGDNEIVGKDASSIDAYITGNTLFVIITDAYPCITYYVDFDIDSFGSVPIRVKVVPGASTLPAGAITFPVNLEGYQLHEGESYYGTIEVHFDNTMGITEDTPYTFSYTLQCVQYNEY